MDAIERVGGILLVIVLLVVDVFWFSAVKRTFCEIIMAFDALATLGNAAFAIRAYGFCVGHWGST